MGDRVVEHDIVLSGGRVIDPGSAADGTFNVGITGRRITAVTAAPISGRTVLDVGGKVVAPGFIDLHSHGQGIAEQRLQALDGVTTALELEAGVHPVDAAYERAAAEGRPIHYGFSASWALARMTCVGGLDLAGQLGDFLGHIAEPGWQRVASPVEVASIVDRLEGDLAAGALGIGVLIGYAPEAAVDEYLAVAGAAAAAGVPTFTHARELVEINPAVVIDGATEVVQAAAATGAHMHYCHINSTSGRHIDRVVSLVGRVQAEGSKVTTEAYPYGAGMTGIGAGFLSPDRLRAQGVASTAITYAPTGERPADFGRLDELRRSDPGGLAFIRFLDDDSPADMAWVERALVSPEAAIASDAMPIHWPGPPPPAGVWPLPPGGITHPRSAGTFCKTLRLAREKGLISLPDAIARATTIPARVLEAAVPALRTKARIQLGADADIVVFDPVIVSDQATYTDTTRPSSGIIHVLVDGTFVVRDAGLMTDTLPGRPLRAGR